jgi:hypothetical protein
MSCRGEFMAPQTETKAKVGFKAGVKDYRLTTLSLPGFKKNYCKIN